MESFFSRYRNQTALGAVLLLQVLGLAVQVKRPMDPAHPDTGSVRLIRLWAMSVVSPFERVVVASGDGVHNLWHDYVNIGGLRNENESLRSQNEQLQIEMARMSEDANQAHRLQSLLGFKEQFVTQTMAAQVIGTSGTDQSHVVYIDKGSREGMKPDFAIITPQGIAGKVRDVGPWSSQVLLINDPLSGVGAILAQSRLYGVVKAEKGKLYLDHVMTDEKVTPGEPVVTSGGDGIFPKGLPIGTVKDVSPGPDLFLRIEVTPAVNLDALDEVLVVTQMQSQQPAGADAATTRAADILAQRLPGVKPKPADAAQPSSASRSAASANAAATEKPKPANASAPATPTAAQKPAAAPKKAAQPNATEQPGPAQAVAKKPAAKVQPTATTAPIEARPTNPEPANNAPAGNQPNANDSTPPPQ